VRKQTERKDSNMSVSDRGLVLKALCGVVDETTNNIFMSGSLGGSNTPTITATCQHRIWMLTMQVSK